MNKGLPRWLVALGVCSACLICSGAVLADDVAIQAQDLIQIPMEKLVTMEVMSASRLAQQVSDAHSAVAIVRAQDIKDYGYRTLADILNSMRGLYTTYDHAYDYLGGRGFSRPGDFAGRVLLMIDGYASNDNLYNQIYLDHAGLLDAELIEQVEYIPGTGSVLYGNNAYFGIVNVITKKGRNIGGAQAAVDVFENGGRKERITFGKTLENGADVLLSASTLGTKGENLYFPEFDTPADNNGVADHQDKQHARRAFGKLQFENWQVEAAISEAKKRIPTAPYGGVFNAYAQNWDTNAFLNLRYDADISDAAKSSTHVYTGYYLDKGAAVYPGDGLWEEFNKGQWWGIDQKLSYTGLAGHKMVLGAEYRNDFRMDFSNPFTQSEHGRRTASLYVQDEMKLSNAWLLNVGGRYDHGSDVGSHFSPRVALTWMPAFGTTVKAAYSTAFRMPAPYEKSYTDGDALGSQLANRRLDAEKIATSELVLQHQIATNFTFTGSLYKYRTQDLIAGVDLPSGFFQYINAGSSHTKGTELELEKTWGSGERLRASYAWQDARDWDNRRPANSPRHLAKVNLSLPVWKNGTRAGFEMQYVGSRLTAMRQALGGYTLANLTLSADRVWRGLSVSATLRNLFDRDYRAVAPDGHVQDSLEMEGRSGWLHLEYDF